MDCKQESILSALMRHAPTCVSNSKGEGLAGLSQAVACNCGVEERTRDALKLLAKELIGGITNENRHPEFRDCAEIEWKGDNGERHFMPQTVMIAQMKALYDEWPGGLDELEASLYGWRRTALKSEGALLEIAHLTLLHAVENDKAVVYASKLGEVLDRAVPGWAQGLKNRDVK